MTSSLSSIAKSDTMDTDDTSLSCSDTNTNNSLMDGGSKVGVVPDSAGGRVATFRPSDAALLAPPPWEWFERHAGLPVALLYGSSAVAMNFLNKYIMQVRDGRQPSSA